MPGQVQMPNVGMIAFGMFIAAFVLLMLAGYPFLAALLFALVLATAVGVFFLVARDRSAGSGEPEPAAAAPVASAAHPAADPAPAPAPTPEPAAAPDAQTPDGRMAEPSMLAAPRGGAADDLKQIRGVGPRIEEALNGKGIYHLDQIAAWGAAEVAWMDEHLEDFRGRVSRDDWVGQARLLADREAHKMRPPH